MTVTQLCQTSLEEIGARSGGRMTVPSYDRFGLKSGIVHFGIGNFHRAHQAVYLDELFNLGIDHDWAICGAGVLPWDEQMRQKLQSQDYLQTIVEQDTVEESRARVIGSMIDFMPVGDIPIMLAKLADPAVRIVSLTITEGGYFIDPNTGAFNSKHPAIEADVANPESPRTVFGMIVAGLKLRNANGIPPFAVLSCDNVPHNGRVARNAVVGLASMVDPEFAAWIAEHVAFPSSMVDRITPATGDRERKICLEQFGIQDAHPVFCERFKHWVVEDNFPSGRPQLELVGVQFVPDVAPYERMKIRILNGGHQVISYAAALMDINFAHEAMQHPLIRALLRKVALEEVLPVVPPVEGIDLCEYFLKIEERFANPNIADTIRRLCFDGSNRQPKFIIPSILDQLNNGVNPAGLALVSALWCRYCHGVTESEQNVEPNDPIWNKLQEKAQFARSNPAEWLAMDEIYGELSHHADFSYMFSDALNALWLEGTETVLRKFVGGEWPARPLMPLTANLMQALIEYECNELANKMTNELANDASSCGIQI